MQKLTANILFSGVGMQERGIEAFSPYKLQVLCTSEIDKGAILSYAAIHCGLMMEMVASYREYPECSEMIKELYNKNIGYNPKKKEMYDWDRLSRKKNGEELIRKYWLATKLSKNLGDISRIKELPYADLWTVSFPCQDISSAGSMKGFAPGSGTKSSLLWENIRLLKTAKEKGISPKYILFENVKMLVSKKFYNDFKMLLEILSDLGYRSYWKVMNLKHCGIPQNRERVFVLCIRDDIEQGSFSMPGTVKLKNSMLDYLHESVDEKYYIDKEMADAFINRMIAEGKIPSLECADGVSYNVAQRGRYIKGKEKQTSQRLELGPENGVINTITTVQKDNYVLYSEADEQTGQKAQNKDELVFLGGIGNVKKRLEDGKDFSRNYKQGYRVYDSLGISAAITADGGGLGGNSGMYLVREEKHE